MRIDLFVIQRKESYPGEYGPEVLAVADEFVQDDNPEWFEGEVARQVELVGKNTIASSAVVRVDLDNGDLARALNPTHRVRARVVDPS